MNSESPITLTHITSQKEATSTREFAIVKGISDDHILHLVEFTNNPEDTAIQNNTSDYKEGDGRFASLDNFEAWMAKGRTIYTLVDKEDNLAGIVWMGEKALDDEYREGTEIDYIPRFEHRNYDTTLAIRTYKNARNQGLAVEFAERSIADYKSQNPESNGIWIVTNEDNVALRSTFTKLGYQVASQWTINDRVLLAEPIDNQ